MSTENEQSSNKQETSKWSTLSEEDPKAEAINVATVFSQASALLDRGLGSYKTSSEQLLFGTNYDTNDKLARRLGRPITENFRDKYYVINIQQTETHKITTAVAGNDTNRGRNPAVLIIEPKDQNQPSYELMLRHSGSSKQPYVTEVTALKRDPQSQQYSGVRAGELDSTHMIHESADRSISASYSTNNQSNNTREGRWSITLSDSPSEVSSLNAYNPQTETLEHSPQNLQVKKPTPDTLEITYSSQDNQVHRLSFDCKTITPSQDLITLLTTIEEVMPPKPSE